jgi:hypothetical protein
MKYIRIIKPRMRWARHAIRMGVTRNMKFLKKVGEHLGDLGIDGRIILKYI